MESLIATFHLDLKLMIAQIVNFAIVFIVLYIFAVKPLMKIMKERSNTIQGGLDNAEKQAELLAEAEKILAEGKRQLDAMAIVEKKKLAKDLEEQRQAAVEDTKTTVARMLEDGRKQLVADKDKILAEAEKEVGGLLIMLAEKAFGEHMDDKLRTKLIEEGVKGL